MLLITDLSGNVVAAWGGDNNTLSSAYPNNPEMQAQYMEYRFTDNKDVLQNPTAYCVIEGLNQEWFYELRKPTTEELLSVIRQKRDILLRDSDWTQLADVPLTTKKKKKKKKKKK